MAYTSLTQPRKWIVTSCLAGSSDLNLQPRDVMEFVGDGNGGATSQILRNGTPWGSECLYSNSNGEVVQGKHLSSSLPFAISVTTSAAGAIQEGAVQSCSGGGSARVPKPGQGARIRKKKGDSEGPDPGGGSWTAEQGG